jgi:uncharacterized membrane-anchored protein YhcB (DUF1043 family)
VSFRNAIILVICVSAIALAWLTFSSRNKTPAPVAPIETSSADKPDSASDNVPRIARPAGFKSNSGDSANHFREWLKNPDQMPILRPEQLDDYLAVNHRNAASLLGALRATHDPQFLKEAEQNFPNDPRVDFAAAFANGISPEERHDWVEKLKENDPGNSMGNYLAARDDLQNGQNAQVLQEMNAAAGKPVPQNYMDDFVQNAQEAYLAAGYSELDAKMAASSEALLPELTQFKQLGRGLSQLAVSDQSAGDAAGAQAANQMAMNLGDQLAGNQDQPLINTLVGLAIEKITLGQMDPSAAYGAANQTVQNQLDQIDQQRSYLRSLTSQSQDVIASMSDSDVANFYDRRRLFGEVPAMQWVVGKYGSGATVSPQ